MSDIDLDKPHSQNEAGVLTMLWRRILKDNRLTPPSRLNPFIDRYLETNDPTEGRVANLKKKNKATIIKNITAPEMTFKTFLDLVFNFLGVVKIDLSIKIHFPNGDNSVHTVTVFSNKNKNRNLNDVNLTETKEEERREDGSTTEPAPEHKERT